MPGNRQALSQEPSQCDPVACVPGSYRQLPQADLSLASKSPLNPSGCSGNKSCKCKAHARTRARRSLAIIFCQREISGAVNGSNWDIVGRNAMLLTGSQPLRHEITTLPPGVAVMV